MPLLAHHMYVGNPDLVLDRLGLGLGLGLDTPRHQVFS